METLDNLAKKYGTDKSSITHNYAEKYDNELKDYRNKFTKILEIGVLNGNSLKMWRDYFVNATIIGMDININHNLLSEQRIKVVYGNQSVKEDLLSVSKLGPFDLIIDDGSHKFQDQIKTFEILFDSLNNGGVYIEEDVCTSYWKEFEDKTSISTIDYFKELIDDVNFKGIRIDNKCDRREKFLIKGWLQDNKKYRGIRSIKFYNSTIMIFKTG